MFLDDKKATEWQRSKEIMQQSMQKNSFGIQYI